MLGSPPLSSFLERARGEGQYLSNTSQHSHCYLPQGHMRKARRSVFISVHFSMGRSDSLLLPSHHHTYCLLHPSYVLSTLLVSSHLFFTIAL